MRFKPGLFLISAALCGSVYGSEVGYWSFDEGTGTLVGDSSVYGNGGMLVNGTGLSWIAGKSGSALLFDGTAGPACTRVEISDSPSLRPSSAFSFAAWLRSDDIFRDAPVFAKEGPGGLSYWFGTFGPSGAGHWGALLDQDGNQPWDFNGRDQGSVALGEWTHIVATWDGSTVSYYLNGNLANTASWTGTINQSGARLFIGSNSEYTFQGNATAFRGAIDEVHIYDNAISAAEVAQLAAVPEPTTFAFLAFGIGGLLARKRRF